MTLHLDNIDDHQRKSKEQLYRPVDEPTDDDKLAACSLLFRSSRRTNTQTIPPTAHAFTFQRRHRRDLTKTKPFLARFDALVARL